MTESDDLLDRWIVSELAEHHAPLGQLWVSETSTDTECVLCWVRPEENEDDEVLEDPDRHGLLCLWRRAKEARA